MYNPHAITGEFEEALCEYTGAKYAVAVNSCTMAILLAVTYMANKRQVITIPSKTYVGVAQSIKNAGCDIAFVDYQWTGGYHLHPLGVWDYARRFTSGMYIPGQYQCLSFHATKILGDSQGGAILHDNDEADEWFRKARFDGRTEGVPPREDVDIISGYHCYISPDVAARLLWRMSVIAKDNPDLQNDDYPDLSKLEVFQ